MKVIAVSFFAPPQLTPQAIQIGRQIYHMDADVTLLHGLDGSLSNSFEQYPDFRVKVRCVQVSTPDPWLTARAARLAMRYIPFYGTSPDTYRGWVRGAVSRGLSLISEQRPDVLATFGAPMSDHLVGLALSKKTGLPWLAHFSDPWVDNSFSKLPFLSRWANRVLERQVIQSASRLVFTSSRTVDLVMSKYSAALTEKTVVVPHAWDMDNFSEPLISVFKTNLPGRIVIRHIGSCYGMRSPEPLFAALAAISEENPFCLNGIRFEFIGYVAEAFKKSKWLDLLPPGLVVFLGSVGYRESLELAASSDALLVIDAHSDTESVYLPSKLIEYIGTERPIFGITPKGTSADVISTWMGRLDFVAEPSDVHGVAKMIETGIGRLKNLTRQLADDSVQTRAAYSAPAIAAQLKAELRTAIKSRP